MPSEIGNMMYMISPISLEDEVFLKVAELSGKRVEDTRRDSKSSDKAHKKEEKYKNIKENKIQNKNTKNETTYKNNERSKNQKKDLKKKHKDKFENMKEALTGMSEERVSQHKDAMANY
jgi:hypothetical protein